MILNSKIRNRIVEVFIKERMTDEYMLYRKGIIKIEEYEVKYKVLNEMLKYVEGRS